MSKQYGIIGLILIVVLATVMISGCISFNTGTNNTADTTDNNDIDSDSNNDKFSNEITFQGVTFYLPDGYEYATEETTDYSVAEVYVNEDEGEKITFWYYPSESKSSVLSNIKSDSDFSNIDEFASFGGYSGISADFKSSDGGIIKVFIFKKNGKMLQIQVTDGLDYEEYFPKIIG